MVLITSAARAQRGYLELTDDRDGPEASFWAVHGCTPDEVTGFRAGISQSVIAAALASRTTVESNSALLDPRFHDRGSVQRHRIQAVLCVPILGAGHHGVMYLQGRHEPGPFTDDDRRRSEMFARHVAAFAERLLLRHRYVQRADPTAPFRSQLKAEELVGSSSAVARVLREAAIAAPVDAGVLITGPTGTGKSLLARVLHRSGRRSRGPFVELNCAALPEALLESELFGAVAGAHSTATRRIEGKVAAAEHGVLFLDEVGELAPAAQAKLLHLLQNREYFPLGGASPVKADLRVIAATNVDLQAAVAQRTFREDLLYRLRVLTIRMPSLSERTGDIPELARHACAAVCESYGFSSLTISPATIYAIQTAEWPGNVRQLGHAIEAAAIRAQSEAATHIEPRHVFPERPTEPASQILSYQEATRQFQARMIRQALDEAGWNISEAARRLDIGRSYLHRLMASFGVTRPDE
nr:sigma-54-dependent Fis family transcriptional regulator [Nannocystis pusilla]